METSFLLAGLHPFDRRVLSPPPSFFVHVDRVDVCVGVEHVTSLAHQCANFVDFSPLPTARVGQRFNTYDLGPMLVEVDTQQNRKVKTFSVQRNEIRGSIEILFNDLIEPFYGYG